MRYSRTSQRRAVILMVVLSLLTLFALVGVTFVLYADAEATAARVAREAQSSQVGDVKPEQALSFFLGQFLYDVPDTVAGANSGIRGHSLARTMYGYFYVSGTATYLGQTILSTATGNLGAGAFVMVQSNATGAVLPAYITAVVPNASITLNIPWPFPTGAVSINTDTNVLAYNGIGRLHYANAAGQSYPSVNPPPITTPLQNVPNNYTALPGQPIDDYALVNYTWFSGDGPMRDPERFGSRLNPYAPQSSPYVGGNAPYTYPDLNNFFLAAMRADGTVLTPSFHRPWLFQMATINVGGVQTPKLYAFNDMTNLNWTNSIGKYLTPRPRPAEHPTFPLPGDANGDVKNLPWAPGGNDSIWVDLGAPVMTAPDGTKYKMMFAPLIVDLDGRINLNTAGNIQNMVSAALTSMGAPNGPAAWQAIAGAHVSNQGWGPWEANLSKVLWADQALYPQTTPPTPPEWIRLFTGASLATTTAPNVLPWIYQPGVLPTTPLLPGLSSWMLPGVRGRYVESLINGNSTNFFSPTVPTPPANTWLAGLGLNGTYPHVYAQVDSNGLNDTNLGATPTPRLSAPGFGGVGSYPFPGFTQGYFNGSQMPAPSPAGFFENTNHPLLYNVFQSPLTNGYTGLLARAFTASDMAFLLQPNASQQGPVNANAAAIDSDLMRLCPMNFPSASTLATLPANIKSLALRYRNLVTTQSWDVGQPGVSPYWWNGGYMLPYSGPTNTLTPPSGSAVQFPTSTANLPPGLGIINVPGTNPMSSEFSPGWRSLGANTSTYLPTQYVYGSPLNPPPNPPVPVAYTTPGARIRLNRPLPPYPHMAAGLTPPYTMQPPPTLVPPPPNGTGPVSPALSPYGVAYNLTPGNAISNQYVAARNARQALANDIYRRLLAIVGLRPPATPATPDPVLDLAPRRWLAQLAVNIVDYTDEDDIMTPFNFYGPADINPTNPAAVTAAQIGTLVAAGTDDPTPTGANPAYWVFGTELPKVVLNEVLAEAQQPYANQADPTNPDFVNVWVELLNTMPDTGAANPSITRAQPQDGYRVPLSITGNPNNPYIISIAQNPMTQPPGASIAQVPDASANPLGKAYVAGPYPQSTSINSGGDFSGAMSWIGGGTQQTFYVPGTGNPINAGVDPPTGSATAPYYTQSPSFLVGPPPQANYVDPFVAATTVSPNPINGVPTNTPFKRTPNMRVTITNWNNPSLTDERTTGLTVMLRRLANPYVPLQTNPGLPNYNPYVTVDYLQHVPLLPTQDPQGNRLQNATFHSQGKTQPYAALYMYDNGNVGLADPNSPVQPQQTNNTPPPAGAYTIPANTPNSRCTFGYGNYPLPLSGHHDWLVHLDRPAVSPMELLHVSAWPPYMLTQQFILGDNTKPGNQFGHYASWIDAPPPLGTITLPGNATANSPTITMGNTTGLNVGATVTVISSTTGTRFSSTITAVVPNTSITLAANWPYSAGAVTVTNIYNILSCPWWYDSNLTWIAGVGQKNSHRLSRLFEFLECGDRAVGVNSLGRIPGKVNINTVWEPEILHAHIDTNTSMGAITNTPSTTPPLPYCPVNPATGLPWVAPTTPPGDLVSQIFANMMSSRSPSYYNNGAYVNALRPPVGPVNMGTATADATVSPPGAGNIWTDDRPFMPLSTGLYLPTGTGYGLGTQFPNGLSVISDTLLRTNNPLASAVSYPPAPPGSPTNNLYLLFQNYYDNGTSAVTATQVTPAIHPYLQTQLLNKLYNNITTRSNTYAIFLTVGFFQVITDSTGKVLNAVGQPNIPQLGPELGRSEGKQVRHRMFSIVDRTNLATLLTTGQAVLPATQVTGPAVAPLNLTGAQSVQLPAGATPNLTVTGSGVGATAQLFVLNPITGAPGVIQQGTQLVIDPGTVFEETVTVTSVTPPAGPGLPAYFTANFTLPHGVNNAPFTIIQRGNPGPWLIPYDPRLDSNVVQYFSIID